MKSRRSLTTVLIDMHVTDDRLPRMARRLRHVLQRGRKGVISHFAREVAGARRPGNSRRRPRKQGRCGCRPCPGSCSGVIWAMRCCHPFCLVLNWVGHLSSTKSAMAAGSPTCPRSHPSRHPSVVSATWADENLPPAPLSFAKRMPEPVLNPFGSVTNIHVKNEG